MSESPARHLNLAGASNFRDLGGYPAATAASCAGGRSSAPTISATLRKPTSMLRSLGVRSAFDFRGTEERVGPLCGIEEIAVHSLPVEPTVVAALRARRDRRGAVDRPTLSR